MSKSQEPAAARLPCELRLEIFEYYFVNRRICYKRYHTLTQAQKNGVPFWSNNVIRDSHRQILVQEPEIDRHTTDLTLGEPGLLKVFRGEALPIYLETLKARKAEEMQRYKEYINKPANKKLSFINAEDNWNQLRDFECRLMALTQLIWKVEWELKIGGQGKRGRKGRRHFKEEGCEVFWMMVELKKKCKI